MLVTPTLVDLAHPRTSSPLAIRFWDGASERFISDGLLVTAAATDIPSLPRIALPNRSHGFVFRTLPGVRDAGFAAADSPFWATPPTQRTFRIEVTDTKERFLPVLFRANAPHPGWFSPFDGTPPLPLPAASVPLYSSPSRSFGERTAAVRADLWDLDAHRPAAWALLRVRLITPEGITAAQGIANPDGRVLVPLGLPETVPPTQPFRKRTEALQASSVTWNLDVQVRYGRLPAGPVPPDLRDILAQPAGLAIDPPRPPLLRNATDIAPGLDLNLRSSCDTLGRVLVRAV